MKKTLTILAALVVGLGSTTAPVHAQGAASLDDLLQDTRNWRQRTTQENQQREARFRQARDRQRDLLRQVSTDLDNEKARTDRLTATFNTNEEELTQLSEDLRAQIGNFGELFGVVKQVAGDANATVNTSIVSAEHADRGDVARRLSGITGLPSIEDLDALRLLLMEEMVESGKTTRFSTAITRPDGTVDDAEVVRLGVFNLVSGNEFLNFVPGTGALQVLPRQPEGRFRNLAEGLFDAQPGEIVSMAVDPSRGSLLSLVVQAPSPGERVAQGEEVGYIIITLGIIGLIIAVIRLVMLSITGTKVSSQLKSETPRQDNPLGRILSVYHENESIDPETLELKLDEAIIREAPKLEKWQNAIKVLAAVAPLLGLLGTVVGMIQVFTQITLFGTGDPKLMAGGISKALVTTMLGLFVAIPLVLLHSWVSGRSRALIEVLEEQTAGIIAERAEKDS